MSTVVLVVIDGFGIREAEEGNAVRKADTPNLDSLFESRFTVLEASGEVVGLPEGFTGNSEVGHLHLGAGRTVPQRLKRINQDVENGKLGERDALVEAFERAEEKDSDIHLAGIVSDGGIHGHIDHLRALMEISAGYDVEVYVHCFTDGRDVDPKSAENYISQVESWCDEYGGEVATVMGRYYAMDRDENWERTFKAYRAMSHGEGLSFKDPREALKKTYEQGDYDYFTVPSVKEGFTGIQREDEVIFYNFRADRERQIQKMLVREQVEGYDTGVTPGFTSMFPYNKDIETPSVFEKKIVEDTLGEEIAERGLKQLRVAESQKIPHVTYFFNGQRELKFEGEERQFIESDKIKSYDQKPEMHADDTTDIVLEALEKGEKDFILLNYANPDLVGHTGDMEATVKAIETVDRNIGRLVEKTREKENTLIVTSDHGNCDKMGTDEKPNTSHSLSPVPLTGLNLEKVEKMEDITGIRELVEHNL